jgi:excisionase family DNA binding protein
MTALLEASPVADELLTRAEAAQLLRVSPRTLDRWADAGRLRRRYLGGSTRLVRFLAAEVRELAQGERDTEDTR